MKGHEDTTIGQNQSTLLEWGEKLFSQGWRIEPRAIFDGYLLEYGPLSEKHMALRGQCTDGGNAIPPLPSTGPAPNAIESDQNCPVCNTRMSTHEEFHNKSWLLCPSCALLTAKMENAQIDRLDKGEPSGAKQAVDSLVHSREYTFCKRVIDGLGVQDVMNYGVGWSLVPEALLAQGIDVVGCDLWQPLIDQRKKELGNERFFHRDECPERRFSLISAFEVFEHFTDPLREIGMLVDHLKDDGAIIGSTDFWHGGSLADHPNHDKTYWQHITHVTAWTWQSLSEVARKLGLNARFLRGDCPEHSAKCFFILYRGEQFKQFAQSLPKVLPDVYGLSIKHILNTEE